VASHYHYEYQTLPASAHRRLARTLKSKRNIVHADRIPAWRFYAVRAAVALLLAALLYLVMAVRLGDPLRDGLWTDTGPMLKYGVLAGLLAFVLLSCARRYRLRKLFQFQPGRYLLPFTLIDARTRRLQVFDLMQMTRFEAQHQLRDGRYDRTVLTLEFQDGSAPTFIFRDRERSEEVLQRFEQLQAAGRSAFDRRDIAALRGYDPLVDLRAAKWVNPEAARHPPAPGPLQRALRHHATVSVLAALILAPALWAARNSVGDVRMQEQARRLATEEAYQGYLAHGRFQLAAMRAELPRVAFAQVRQRHSVTALRQLLQRYPRAGLERAVAGEIHILYGQALQRFKDQAVQADASLVAAMASLLAHAERTGNPNVPIQFVRPTAEALRGMDDASRLQGARQQGLQMIPAAEYFSNDSASAREQRIAGGLRAAFGTIFAHDVLQFSAAGSDAARAPLLLIRYQIDPSGVVYREENGHRGFVGLVARFQAGLAAPDLDTPWRFALDVTPPPQFSVEYKTGGGRATGPSDGQVYAIMAERAFDSLSSKIMGALFRPDSVALVKLDRAADARPRPAVYTP
jgi:hypothetical protein